MSATAEKKPAKAKPKARVAARDLRSALGPARSAKADHVTVNAKDRTLRFDTPSLAAVLPFAGTKGSGRAVKVKRRDLDHVVRSVGGGDMLLTEDDGRLHIDAARATVALPEAYVDPISQAREHPFDGEPTFTLDARALARTLLRAEPFASRDETRPVLTTIALDCHRRKAITTDSYRLSIFDAPELPRARKGTPPLLLHVRGAVPLATALASTGGEVTVTRGTDHALFTFGDQRWSVATEGGQYPHYDQLLPDRWSASFELSATELAEAAALIAGLSIRNAPAVLTLTEKDGATLTVRDTSDLPRCSVELSARATGEPDGPILPMGISPDFLLDAARALAPEEITLKIISPLRPMLLQGADSTQLLMPIRLNV